MEALLETSRKQMQSSIIGMLQGAAEAKDFAWPAGDVAAPVLAWATPQECAMLYTHTLRAWGLHC
jgi:hypothetical protein